MSLVDPPDAALVLTSPPCWPLSSGKGGSGFPGGFWPDLSRDLALRRLPSWIRRVCQGRGMNGFRKPRVWPDRCKPRVYARRLCLLCIMSAVTQRVTFKIDRVWYYTSAHSLWKQHFVQLKMKCSSQWWSTLFSVVPFRGRHSEFICLCLILSSASPNSDTIFLYHYSWNSLLYTFSECNDVYNSN